MKWEKKSINKRDGNKFQNERWIKQHVMIQGLQWDKRKDITMKIKDKLSQGREDKTERKLELQVKKQHTKDTREENCDKWYWQRKQFKNIYVYEASSSKTT